MNKDWLDISVLEDYLDGKLDAKTMNRVEREALDDPFVAEALAGLSESPKRSLQSISMLQKQLHERVAELQSVKKTSVITWQRLSIAATAAVMFIAVSVMFWMRENNLQKELAGRPKKVDVTIAPTKPAETPAVEAAPMIANESADQVKEKEIDKAIAAAKTNSYASRVKPKTKAVLKTAAPVKQSDEIVLSAPSNDSLKEVAVVAMNYGKAKKEMIMDSGNLIAGRMGDTKNVQIRGMNTLPGKEMISNPVGGWKKLFEYIKTNNSFAKSEKTGQSVELSFMIDKEGKPTVIKVLKGADDKYEEEAIRLILNGPKWEQPKKADSRMTFIIDF